MMRFFLSILLLSVVNASSFAMDLFDRERESGFNSFAIEESPEFCFQENPIIHTAPNESTQADQKARVLDLGSGYGTAIAHIATERPHWQIMSINSNVAATNIATQKYKGYSNLSFRCVDVRDVTLDLKFDLVLCNDTLEWLHPVDQAQVLSRMAAALKKGGYAQVSMAGKYFEEHLHSLNKIWPLITRARNTQSFLRGYASIEQYHPQTKYQFETMAAKSGFEVLNCQIETIKKDFSSMDAYLAWIGKKIALMPIMAWLMSEQKGMAISQIVTEFADYAIKGKNGCVSYEVAVLKAFLKKNGQSKQK